MNMENSDGDSSYEMVDWNDFCMTESDSPVIVDRKDYCMTDSDKENSPAERESPREIGDWKEFCMSDSDAENSLPDSKSPMMIVDGFCTAESSQENLSTESEASDNGMGSSDLECYGVITDLQQLYLDKAFQVHTAVDYWRTASASAMSRYPARREIKDLVQSLVLPFLPAKSLVRFKTVSKSWNDWISSPFLAHTQSYRFQNVSGFFCQDIGLTTTFLTLTRPAYGVPDPSLNFLPEPVLLRSSCNGLLLCQGRFGENMYYVCNPVKKEWRILPPPNYYHDSELAIVLAFEPSMLNFSADFEVICAFPLIGFDEPMIGFDEPIFCFEIYSSKEMAWRCSNANCIELGRDAIVKGGFYSKGMVYWETSSGKTLVFNMENEVCGVLPLPMTPNGVLAQIKGELCYIWMYNRNLGAYVIEIYGGMDMSLKHNINLEFWRTWENVARECRVLACVDGDIVILLVGSVMYSYDLRAQKVCVVSQNNNFGSRYLPYVNSLVSLI